MPSKFKWRLVFEALTAELDSGDWRPGDAFYPMKTVRERFAVSDITARRVYDELKTRGRIRANGRKGSFVLTSAPGGAGAVPVAPQTVFLCFLARNGRFDAADGFGQAPHLYHEILKGFRRPPFDRLFEIKPVSIEFCLGHLDAFRGAGVIMNQETLFSRSGGRPGLDPERVAAVRRHLTPVVFQVFESLPGMTEVRIDKAAGIRAMVDCLARAGHTRIGYLSGTVTDIFHRSRFEGYLDALATHGFAFNPAWMGVTTGDDREHLRGFMARLMAASERPTALVCTHDAAALAVLAWCREQCVRVPDDLAVTGFDNLPESELSQPPLTTVDQRLADMGEAALDLLRRRQAGNLVEPAKITITPRIMERASHGSSTRFTGATDASREHGRLQGSDAP